MKKKTKNASLNYHVFKQSTHLKAKQSIENGNELRK